uniref:DUF4395 domain-containing protein n=1 Tax=Lotharella globosa TaxID=91324 RepID=A0A7S4DN35_9EUKA
MSRSIVSRSLIAFCFLLVLWPSPGRTPGKRYLNENAVRARAGLLMLTAVAVVIVLLQIENPRFLIYTVAPVAGWDMLSGAIFGLTPFAPYGIAGTLLAWGKAPEWKPAGPKRFAWTLGFFMVCICVVMGALRLRIGTVAVC